MSHESWVTAYRKKSFLYDKNCKELKRGSIGNLSYMKIL